MKIAKEKIKKLIMEEINAELKESNFDYVQMYKSIRQLKRVLKDMQDSGQELPPLQAGDIAREAKDILRIAMELGGGMAGAPGSLKEASMGILEEQSDPQMAQMIQKIAEMLQNMQGILQLHERKIQQLHKELRDVQRRR